MKDEKYLYSVVSNWTGKTVFESCDYEEALTKMQELNTSNYYKGKMHELFNLEKTQIKIDLNKIKELEQVRGIELTTVKEVFDDLSENQIVIDEHGNEIDLNKKIYAVGLNDCGGLHASFYDENGNRLFLLVENKGVYAVAVVENNSRCVWESKEIKGYEIALDVFKDECKRSNLEVILYKKIKDKWQIIKDRPQA